MTLDEQLAIAQTKALNIQALASKRDVIKNLIQNLAGAQDQYMMSPLSALNVALSAEEIAAISEEVIAKVSVKLVEVETELETMINS